MHNQPIVDEYFGGSDKESYLGFDEGEEKLIESGEEETFYGFSEEDLQKDRAEEELATDMKFWKEKGDV